MHSEEFYAERASCIGGSDIHHLFCLEPYGCDRRLFYDKWGTPADYPFVGNAHTRRGEALEPIAVREYERETGRICGPVPFIRKAEYPELGVHIDRSVVLPEPRPDGAPGSAGVLEVKVPGREMFQYVKYHGPLLSWQLQLQHALGVSGWQWGSILAFNADLWKLVYWDFSRDEEIIERIREKALPFWINVLKARHGADFAMPGRLDPSDARCQSCPWRKTCQGQELIPEVAEQELLPAEEIEKDTSLFQLSLDLIEAKQIAKEAKDQEEGLTELLKERMGDRQVVQTGAARVTYRNVTRKAYSVPESVSRQLRIYPNREDDA
jgi:predicted phage-related endonuclease